MSNEWRKLYEIEDFRNKLKKNEIEYVLNGHVFPGKCISECTIADEFEKTAWRLAKPELPSYDEWLKDNQPAFTMVNHDYTIVGYAGLTCKELLRRYIRHLADIVNEGWVAEDNGYNIFFCLVHGEELHVCNSGCRDGTIRFKTGGTASRVINHCPKELKELYGE